MKEVWSVRPPSISATMDLTSLTNIMKAESVSNSEIQVVISTMDFISTPPPLTEVVTADATLEALQLAGAQLETELNNFMTTAFPSTTKALKTEKKDALAIMGVSSLKKEFRLPTRQEVKPSECERASEAWSALKGAHQVLTKTILRTLQCLEHGSRADTPSTLKWTKDKEVEVTKGTQDAVKKLLLTGILLGNVYSKALTKAQLEFSRIEYNRSFENLKGYKIPRSLRTARRRARQSEECRREAVELLEEEQEKYDIIVSKWDKECERWESRREDAGTYVFQEQQRILNKCLGTSHLRSVLPETAEVAEDMVKDILDFIPSVRELESQLTSHEQEAEETADAIEGEFVKMKESLEPKEKVSRKEGTKPPLHESTPKQRGVRFDLPNTVLFHDNIALSTALTKLRSAYNTAKERGTVESRELLKARVEMAKSKKGEMNICSGTDDDIKEAYTSLEELDELLIRVTAFINLEEGKDQRKREEERTKGILAAKSMPTTKIPVFSGRREDFWEWFLQFQAASSSTLPSAIREGHLRQAIRDPATQDAIKGCQTYNDMEDELRRNFGSREDELNRLVAQLDLIPRPRSKIEESYNMETLRKINKKLKAINEEHVLDKLKLGKWALQGFLPRTREELMLELHSKKESLIQDYSITKGIDLSESKNLALREKIPEVEISNEDYCSCFWNFLETRAEIGRAMRAQLHVTGSLVGNPRQVEDLRSNMVNTSKEPNGTGAGRMYQRQCAFTNCRASTHFSGGCDKNLQRGNIPRDIIQLCKTSKVCVRCLRGLDYSKHDETCTGSYKRKDNTWVQSDCGNSNCRLTLSNGKKIPFNRRICYHAQKREQTADNPSNTQVNSLGVDGGLEDEFEYEVPSAFI